MASLAAAWSYCLISPVVVTQRSTSNKQCVSIGRPQTSLTMRLLAQSHPQSRVVAMATHGPAGVEPDLSEELVESWGMAGDEMEKAGTFRYGKTDGHHTFHDGDEGTFLDQWNLAMEKAGGPTGSQKWISFLFLPNFFIMVAYGVQPEYYVIYTVLFLFAFIGLEMAKPEKPTNFEPEMYTKK